MWLVRTVKGDTSVSLADVRAREWKAAAYDLLRAGARDMGILRRVEPAIDGEIIVVEPDGVDELIARMARHRFGTKEYAALTEQDAQRAVLRQIAAAGGLLSGDLMDEGLEVEYFPLGYHLRDAMRDLQALGAVDVVRTKGQMPLLRLNETSRDLLRGEAE